MLDDDRVIACTEGVFNRSGRVCLCQQGAVILFNGSFDSPGIMFWQQMSAVARLNVSTMIVNGYNLDYDLHEVRFLRTVL